MPVIYASDISAGCCWKFRCVHSQMYGEGAYDAVALLRATLLVRDAAMECPVASTCQCVTTDHESLFNASQCTCRCTGYRA